MLKNRLKFLLHNIQFGLFQLCFHILVVPWEETKYFYLTKIKGLNRMDARLYLQDEITKKNLPSHIKQRDNALGVFAILLLTARLRFQEDDDYAATVAAVQLYAVSHLALPAYIPTPLLYEGKEMDELKLVQYQLFRMKTFKDLVDAFSFGPDTRQALEDTLHETPRFLANQKLRAMHRVPNFDPLFEKQHLMVTHPRVRGLALYSVPRLLEELGLLNVEELKALHTEKSVQIYEEHVRAMAKDKQT